MAQAISLQEPEWLHVQGKITPEPRYAELEEFQQSAPWSHGDQSHVDAILAKRQQVKCLRHSRQQP